ncbi:MAG: UDP-N-acetylmuramate dehydrogenase [Spirochaetes bacterium]|nr:UDP-N-acetylmuramate dehydrogenase [Spirochaetota bacterium]
MKLAVNLENMLNNLGTLKTNEPLKKYTSFKTGGPAEYMIWPKDRSALKDIILICGDNSIDLTVLGGCSNLLVSDAGIKGIVVMMNSFHSKADIKLTEEGTVYSDSGVDKKDFLKFCVDSGFQGMEFIAGIFGCVGGGIAMNAGTADGAFAEILQSIEYMNSKGEIINKPVSSDMFGYRKLQMPGCSIILGGYFKLEKADNTVNIQSRINDILKERKSKHPLNYPSAGSVFKNPDGYSSWKLVDEAGLKGKSIGGARVSDLHTNFIINNSGATSEDILNLINEIKEVILNKYNIKMETEIRVLGDFF